eukprot:c26185_g1_i1 orf=570-1868(-)
MVEKRVYQVWKGSNKFLFCGRLIFGPDVRSLVVTVFLMVVPAVIFFVFVARHLLHRFPNHNSGIAIMVVAVVFTIYVLILLLLTSGRDPGIIPRSPHPPEPDECNDSANSPAEWVGRPRTKDVTINGVAVKIKYCDTCMLYRPPRCSHCSICNNCVERFDHHCPWVGQCIGKRNYRYFFMFVSSTTVLCIYVFAFSALYIKFLMEGDSETGSSRTLWQAIRKSPASLILMVYTFVAVWFVGGLTLFHLYLIGTNQTTYENFRYRYDNRINPYNLGVIHNFQEILCSTIGPSKNKFRAKVQLDASGQIVTLPEPSSKVGTQSAIVVKPAWEAGESECTEEARGHVSACGDIGVEIKDTYEDAFTKAIGHPLSLESSDTRAHPRRSSWGRKSDSWEITPDILALASGHGDGGQLNGDGNPPRERAEEKSEELGS